MKIDVYCDGSATVSTNPGGFGWVIVIDDVKHSEGSGRIENATNNDAELIAAIESLVAVFKFVSTNKLQNPEITLISDSRIVLNWASGAHRFKQTSKIDKYNTLRALVERMKVKTQWIRGHSGNIYNSRCDKLANWARKGIPEPPPPNKPRDKTKLGQALIKGLKEAVASENITKKSLIGKKKLGTISFWYKGTLKVIDFRANVVEDYNQELHGVRKSYMEIKDK